MVGVFTPFLAEGTAAQVASVMGGWEEGLNALRCIGMDALAALPWSRHVITASSSDEDVCRSCGKHPDDHKVWLFGWRYVETDDAFAEIALAIVGLDRPRSTLRYKISLFYSPQYEMTIFCQSSLK